MANAGKYEAGDTTFKWLKENELSIGEVQGDVWLVYLDTIFSGDEVAGLRVEAKSVQGGKDVARRLRGGAQAGKQEKQEN